jgi:hypothetical protein
VAANCQFSVERAGSGAIATTAAETLGGVREPKRGTKKTDL